MKKKTIGRIAVFAFVLSMVSTCLISGTLAKYTTEANGTGSITVATFTEASLKKGETVLTSFDLSATKTTNEFVNTTTIAPGDKGSFDVVLSASQVAYNYTISIGKLVEGVFTYGQFNGGKAIPVKFYSDSEMTQEITAAFTGTKTVDDANNAVTIPIYWKWVSTGVDDDAINAADNTAESLGTDTFAVRITADQKMS